MTIAVPPAAFMRRPDVRQAAWRTHLIALGLVAGALLALFARDVAELAHLWWTSTTFGHCLFIGPVLAWLVWQRRAGLAQLTPVAWWPGLLLVLAGGFGWLLGAAASVALVRQLALVLMLDGAVVTILGPRVARGLLFPLCYAVFLVPFGESMEGPLQTVTVAMVMPLLHAFGVRASVDGVLITIPNGWFEVAEACSGDKFVIAMLAFGTLVANVCYVTWWRRAAFLAMALAVPVVANGIRAFATIYAAYWTSVATATGYDHIVFGWIFFGLVMAAVLAIGWRWFDRDPDAPWFDADAIAAMRVSFAAPLWPAAALVLASAALFPGWSQAIAGRAAALPPAMTLPAIPGWQRVAADPRGAWSPNYPGADALLQGRYADAQGDAVDVAVAVFGHQSQGRELVGFGIGVLREDDVWVRVEDQPPIDGGSVMRITSSGGIERIVATWYRLGDVVTSSPVVVKLQTLKARLLGGPQAAVAIHVAAIAAPGHDPRGAVRRFVAAAGPLNRLADRIDGRRR